MVYLSWHLQGKEDRKPVYRKTQRMIFYIILEMQTIVSFYLPQDGMAADQF